MARPIKDGVDYFPKDTAFYTDDKVRLLRAEFGAKGMYLLDYILCEIYGKNGYFMQWDQSRCYLVSDGAGCGCDPNFVGEFVAGCVRCSFFDKRVFDLFGVLTSQGIQRRYIRMFNSRDEIAINEDYFLLDITSKKDVPQGSLNKLRLFSDKSTGNPDKSTGNPDKSTGNPQSKVKQSKVKENKYIGAPAQKRAACPDELFPMILSNGKEKGFSQQMIDQWKKSYPLVDVEQELKEMQSWCLSNPQKRKTAAEITRFANSWLARAQEESKAKQKPAIRYESNDILSELPELELEDV